MINNDVEPLNSVNPTALVDPICPKETIEKAQERLTSWLSETAKDFDPNQLKMKSAKAHTFMDGSLDCPQPGYYYTQALEQGFILTFEYQGKELNVHATSRHDDPRIVIPAQISYEMVKKDARESAYEYFERACYPYEFKGEALVAKEESFVLIDNAGFRAPASCFAYEYKNGSDEGNYKVARGVEGGLKMIDFSFSNTAKDVVEKVKRFFFGRKVVKN